MTREQVIKGLQGIRIALDMDGHHNDAQTVADALALLKTQEPKQAKKLTFHVKTTLGYEKPIVATRYDWLCPTCESLLCRDIDVIDDNYHYCKVCGQAVKWE